MQYAVEMGSGVMICIPGFLKIGSGIQKLMGGGGPSQTAWRSHKLFRDPHGHIFLLQ
jgi:hypothetical protein